MKSFTLNKQCPEKVQRVTSLYCYHLSHCEPRECSWNTQWHCSTQACGRTWWTRCPSSRRATWQSWGGSSASLTQEPSQAPGGQDFVGHFKEDNENSFDSDEMMQAEKLTFWPVWLHGLQAWTSAQSLLLPVIISGLNGLSLPCTIYFSPVLAATDCWTVGVTCLVLWTILAPCATASSLTLPTRSQILSKSSTYSLSRCEDRKFTIL